MPPSKSLLRLCVLNLSTSEALLEDMSSVDGTARIREGRIMSHDPGQEHYAAGLMGVACVEAAAFEVPTGGFATPCSTTGPSCR
jgi:hypothetical protein